jgi:two-component SAPR family response regulator
MERGFITFQQVIYAWWVENHIFILHMLLYCTVYQLQTAPEYLGTNQEIQVRSAPPKTNHGGLHEKKHDDWTSNCSPFVQRNSSLTWLTRLGSTTGS